MRKSKSAVGVTTGLVLIVVLGALAYWYFSVYISDSETVSTVDFISEHYNSKGEFIDYFNEVGFTDINDVHFVVKDDKVRIYFGDITLEWDINDFATAETQALLKKIHITMYKDKSTGKLRLFYDDEEIERWAS